MGFFDWLMGRPAAPPPDPWTRTGRVPCNCRFGAGRQLHFEEYLRGPSRVTAGSVNAVKRWLSRCTYVTDQEQFGVEDHWLHPSDFERVRRGDCEDFSLWGWRKLVDLGYQATLVIGWWTPPGKDVCRHAWVLVDTAEGPHVLEGTVRFKEMLQPLEAVRGQYHPDVGVDARGVAFLFHGGLCRRCVRR